MSKIGKRQSRPSMIVADGKGRLYDMPGIEPAGMKAGHYFKLRLSDLTEIHPDSDLFLLPSRRPVGFDPATEKFTVFDKDPFNLKMKCLPVAAFLAPGYTASFSAAYASGNNGASRQEILPLFSYAAVCFHKGRFLASGVRVDREKRQELSGMDVDTLKKNVKKIRKLFPHNRLVKHLERCALEYCCPAGRNFFLQRYEAPLPSSPTCNAFCRGCISFQPGSRIPVTQPRITFVPTPEEIAEVAVFHLEAVKDPVVSFGQGCEGEPLMVGKVLLDAVTLIRKSTLRGIINLNTNASKPELVSRLFDRGLDSMRVSVNSAQETCYRRYYQPRGYAFIQVVKSIKAARKAEGFVSLNYLTMPGFTDSIAEINSFRELIHKTDINMIQWRNLNYDPLEYYREMKERPLKSELIGIKETIKAIRKDFPNIMQGYFNPSRARMKRFRKASAPQGLSQNPLSKAKSK